MANYSVRLTWDYETLAPFWSRLDADTIVVYEHPADAQVSRTHCHAFVWGLKNPTDTVKNWIRLVTGEMKPDKDKWRFSTTWKDSHTGKRHPVENDGKMITYMHKGRYDCKYYKGIDQTQLKAYESEWVDRTKSTLSVKNGKFVKKLPEDGGKALTRWEMLEKIREIYDPKKHNEDDTLDLIRNEFERNRQVVGLYKILDFYDALMFYENKTQLYGQVKNALAKRMRVQPPAIILKPKYKTKWLGSSDALNV